MNDSKNRLERLLWSIKDHRYLSAVILLGAVVISIGSFFGALDDIKKFWAASPPQPKTEASTPKVLKPFATNDWHYEAGAPRDTSSKILIESAYLLYDKDGFPTLRYLIKNPLEHPASLAGIYVVATIERRTGGGSQDTIFATRELNPVEYILDISSIQSHLTNTSKNIETSQITFYLEKPIIIAENDFISISIKLVETIDGGIAYPTRFPLTLSISFMSDHGQISGPPPFELFRHINADRMIVAADCHVVGPIGNIIPRRYICE